MTDNRGGTYPKPEGADQSGGQKRQPEGEEPENKPKKPGRRGVFDIYAAYNPKQGQARVGLSITISRKPGTKR
ncbi:MAG TPA: hypothetical protein VHU91_00755 [Mycobacteriales bacterium]|jgi:hypothetical protein|nr:hypothetical protein [Mycobacteriales bacterium]